MATDSYVLESLTTHCGTTNGCPQDIGIWVVYLVLSTSNNVVKPNAVTGSGLDGIQLSRFTTRNTVIQNSVLRNGISSRRL